MTTTATKDYENYLNNKWAKLKIDIHLNPESPALKLEHDITHYQLTGVVSDTGILTMLYDYLYAG